MNDFNIPPAFCMEMAKALGRIEAKCDDIYVHVTEQNKQIRSLERSRTKFLAIFGVFGVLGSFVASFWKQSK